MSNIYRMPDPQLGLCRSFKRLATNTWNDLRDSNRYNHSISEDSITDFLILQLKRWHNKDVKLYRFNRNQEKQTGADWVWAFLSGKKWRALRIQAKKLDCRSNRYESLSQGYSLAQADTLIRQATKKNLEPLYCFFNYWQENEPKNWHCRTRGSRLSHWGCALASASVVRQCISRREFDIEHIRRISYPWERLVCPCGGTDPKIPLVSRIDQFLKIANQHDRQFSEQSNPLPAYLQKILQIEESNRSDESAEHFGFDDNVAGIVVVQDYVG